MPAILLPLVAAAVGQISTLHPLPPAAQRAPTQSNPAPAPAGSAIAEPADPLAGHPVKDHAAATGIVEQDFQGKLRRPEPTVIEAALTKIQLSPDEHEKVEKILRERALVLDKFVEENLDLLTKFGNAEHSTDGKDKFMLAVEAYQKLEPLRTNGPLDKQVRGALSEENGARFDTLLREYWNALVEEDSHATKPKGRLGVITGAKFEDLGHEIEAAFHRAERGGGVLYGYLFKSMTLTDDQSKRLHELCAMYSATGLDDKSKGEQGTFFLAVTQVLDADQRKVFVARLKGK